MLMLHTQINQQLKQALGQQGSQIMELLRSGQELTVNLQLEVVPKAKTS
jgi:hypothetical protein